MAGRARFDNLDEQGVPVAVGSYRNNLLGVARGFALAPKALTGTAVEAGFALLDCDIKAFFVHVGKHENLFAVIILHNCRDKSVRIKFKFNHFLYPHLYFIVIKITLQIHNVNLFEMES